MCGGIFIHVFFHEFPPHWFFLLLLHNKNVDDLSFHYLFPQRWLQVGPKVLAEKYNTFLNSF